MSDSDIERPLSYRVGHGPPRRLVEPGTAPSIVDRAPARWPRWSIMAADAICVGVGVVVPYSASAAVTGNDVYLLGRSHYLVLMSVAIAVFLMAFASQGLYTTRRVTRPVNEVARQVVGCSMGAAGIWIAAFLLKYDISRAWALAVPILVLLLIVLQRQLLDWLLWRVRGRGYLLRRVVLVGDNAETRSIAQILSDDLTLGYRVASIIEAPSPDDPGSIDAVVDELHRCRAEAVVIVVSAVDHEMTTRLIRRLNDIDVHIEVSSNLRDISAGRLSVDQLGRLPIIHIRPTVHRGWRARAKRAFDIVIASAALALLVPVLATVALAIKIDSRGPVIFRQQRIGRHFTAFDVFKFRTMYADAEEHRAELESLNEADGPLFKIADDPRVTRIGRMLRATSIDELPQLINVLRGEMSLVGPRPALFSESEQWSPELFERLRVRPGITGMWQVSGRSDTSFDEYSRLDLYYVDNWTLAADLSILVRTIPAVIGRRGAR